MSVFVILTIIFVILKCAHMIDWSWWLVCAPLMVEVGLDILIWCGGVGVILKVLK